MPDITIADICVELLCVSLVKQEAFMIYNRVEFAG